MYLIKLTAVPGQYCPAGPCYVDAHRIIAIIPATYAVNAAQKVRERNAAPVELDTRAREVTDYLATSTPDMTDPAAVIWMIELRNLIQQFVAVDQAIRRMAIDEGAYERQDCTEIQLACGTSLEHGVMLARLHVTEKVDDIASLIVHLGHSRGGT